MNTDTKNMPPPAYIQAMPYFVLALDPEVQTIRDWLPWSIITIFVALGLIGFIPLIFSILCHSNKQNNDFHEAKSMSTLALVFNIILTLLGAIGWIILIVYFALVSKAIKDISNS